MSFLFPRALGPALGPILASLSDPHLCLAAGYQMAFDARKLAGRSREGEKPGQRVGVIQLPAGGRDGKTVSLCPGLG